jgi:hypothetical protein
MPEIEWSLLCEYCLVDAAGKLSVLGIFDQMLTAQLPVHQPVLYVVTRWRGAPDAPMDAHGAASPNDGPGGCGAEPRGP